MTDSWCLLPNKEQMFTFGDWTLAFDLPWPYSSKWGFDRQATYSLL